MTTSTATGRHRGDGSRPSGKQITAKVVRASATTNGHTPSHPHHGLAPAGGRVTDLAAEEHDALDHAGGHEQQALAVPGTLEEHVGADAGERQREQPVVQVGEPQPA